MTGAAPLLALLLTLALALPGSASACSQDDTAYFDGFLDASCLGALSGTKLDTFGGLRLTTSGTPTTAAWDTEGDFLSGVEWEGTPFPPVGLGTLEIKSGGPPAAAALVLPETLLPLTRYGANPVLGPTAATVLDNDNVDDPSVVKVGSKYVMWYSGTAEDGSGPAIFAAESSDAQTWTRLNSGEPVLTGSEGAFDEHGVSGPDVVYDAGDPGAPYKMWYAGSGEIFGAIGYATSTDGIAWTKRDDPETVAATDPVLDHGAAGSPDSFAAADPSVLRDGTTWKMWYTGDDSNKKRVAYATSPDGVAWTKGGKVISPEDEGANANYDFGAFAPTVWKDGEGFEMLLAGRKNLGTAEEPVFQTRVMSASSKDGISWSAPSPEINPQSSRFDSSNLNSPDILLDPSSPKPFKLYYSGNAIDANGHFHTRIGLATSPNGNSFSRFDGPESCLKCVLDIGAPAAAFDARDASGLSVVAPAGGVPKLVGFYSGSRGSDFKPRLGEATSPDGSEWTKVPVSEADGGAVFALGTGEAFDRDGQRDPSVLYEQDGSGEDDYFLYFTGLKGATGSIGLASAEEDETSRLPEGASWSARSQVLEPDGSGFDAAGVSHPSAIKTGVGSYVMYYAGTASGVSKIGRAIAVAPGGPWIRDLSPVLDLGAAGSFDATTVKDPVVFQASEGAPFRMLYTGVEAIDGETIERVGYATSNDGISWTKQGVVLNPSQEPHAGDEVGVEPSGALIDEGTLHVFSSGVDRDGRTRGDHATASFPTPVAPEAGIPNGWATFQLGDETTPPRDFRSVTRTSSGNGVALWMSYEQPYSKGGGDQFWSDYFPVTIESEEEALSFLLTVSGVRWQARLSEPAEGPALDRVEIDHAPVEFSASGSATTGEIAPPEGVAVSHWNSLTASGELFSPSGSGSASGTVEVLSADGSQVLASKSLSTNGDTTIDLSALSAATYPSLRARFKLASAAPYTATPLVRSLKVLYNSALPPLPPPPPPPPPLPKCLGKEATIVGTAGPDVVVGTAKADVIVTLGGNDRVKSLGGNDLVCAGGGLDKVFAAAGADKVHGGGGPDIVYGGGGGDKVFGARGNDRAYGGGGRDYLFGNAGKDLLAGGAGLRDLCNGGAGRKDRGARSCERLRLIP